MSHFWALFDRKLVTVEKMAKSDGFWGSPEALLGALGPGGSRTSLRRPLEVAAYRSVRGKFREVSRNFARLVGGRSLLLRGFGRVLAKMAIFGYFWPKMTKNGRFAKTRPKPEGAVPKTQPKPDQNPIFWTKNGSKSQR